MENWPLILNTPGYFLFVQMEGKGNEITKTNNKSSYQSLGRNKTWEEIVILMYLNMYISSNCRLHAGGFIASPTLCNHVVPRSRYITQNRAGCCKCRRQQKTPAVAAGVNTI
jgi:hypothetical protein